MQRTDYALGFPAVLSGLTKGCEYDEETFLKRFDEMIPRNSDTYKVVVVVHHESNKIVASGCLMNEKKFIRDAGTVSTTTMFQCAHFLFENVLQAGHIEDVVVSETMRGKQLGKKIVLCCADLAWASGCYKILLDCDEKNIGFYQKCGLEVKGTQMGRYAPGVPPKNS